MDLYFHLFQNKMIVTKWELIVTKDEDVLQKIYGEGKDITILPVSELTLMFSTREKRRGEENIFELGKRGVAKILEIARVQNTIGSFSLYGFPDNFFSSEEIRKLV